MEIEQLRELAAEEGWFHSIDLGHGLITKGVTPPQGIPDSVLPDFHGRSVLDVGAWDGGNSFRAERMGASRVVALDHYVWGVDLARRQKYWDECASRGEMPDQSLDETEFWDEALPGRRHFDLAREAIQSSVEPVVGDFMKLNVDQIGTFDVVLYLGVLYHMKEPLTALERVLKVTTELAVIETAAVDIKGHDQEGLVQFVAGNELNNDFGNWYLPTESGLHAMCKAAGFKRVVTKQGPEIVPVVRHAVAERVRGRGRTPSAPTNYRLTVHAYV
jgi:tRNA (mo5U34)-methyltransferase